MSLPDATNLAAVRPTRLHSSHQSSAGVFSLPVPPDCPEVAADGILSQSVPVAWWPGRFLNKCGAKPGAARQDRPSAYPDGEYPRRLLVTLCADDDLPTELAIRPGGAAHGAADKAARFDWEVATLERNHSGHVNWEVNELILRHRGKELGLRMGLLTDADGLMWWEWVRCEQVWAGPACTAIRAAGYASSFRLTEDHPDYRDHRVCPWVHHQHWILCEIYALLFANGVVHVTARHVNNHLYDDNGQDIEGVVPVMGFRGTEAPEGPLALTGGPVEVDLGTARINTEECRTLASPEHPGRIWTDGGLTLLQPYEGVDIPLGGYGRDWRRKDTGFVCQADERRIPAGVGRTVRCCLSLGSASPRVERYTLPYWWYGLCAELTPQPMLPVSDHHDPVIDAAGEWLRDSQLTGRFADGSVPRGSAHYSPGGEFSESGWEGETPFNLLRWYYRRPSLDTWNAALRDLYYIADVATDHVHFMMHMHGYPFGAISITMNRSLGIIQGYLETGDPYLRETAENMALCSWAMDSANWPRRSYGRDAMYIRGLVALEDYLPGRGHGPRAREAIGRAISCQREDGSYSDQGGPAGLHGTGNLVIKPWMNFMVMEPMIDWLERHPDDAEVAECVRRICDWELETIVKDGDQWHFPYEWAWGDNPGWPGADPGAPNATHPFGNLPGAHYPARALLFASRFFDDPRYAEAWERCYETLGGRDEQRIMDVPHTGDHAANKAIECLTWHQMNRWQARWYKSEISTSPYPPEGPDREATIITPSGTEGKGHDAGDV